MNESKKEKGKLRTPEQRFDEAILYESMYGYAIWTVLFLFVGVAFFIGVMPRELLISLAALFSACLVLLVLSPLLGTYNGKKHINTAVICNYFPMRKKEFVVSKIKIVSKYILIFWFCSLVAQLLAVPFWNFHKLFLYQGILLVFSYTWTVLFIWVQSGGKN